MDSSQKPQANSLFQVYLRLRPQRKLPNTDAERFLVVEESEDGDNPTHITLNPPMDRRRAIEKFAFTRVFEEHSSQLDIFHGTRVLPLVEGVLAPHGGEGTDGLLATLGVTGSGKTHTMLGSRQQRGMTQLALDVMFRSIDASIVDCTKSTSLEASIQASDCSDATLLAAPAFLETIYGDLSGPSRAGSRAATPMIVREPNATYSFPYPPADTQSHFQASISAHNWLHGNSSHSSRDEAAVTRASPASRLGSPARACERTQYSRSKLTSTPLPVKNYMNLTSATRLKNAAKTNVQSDYGAPPPTPRRHIQRPSVLPQAPDISGSIAESDSAAEYAVVISMYEVYNDRIFDLLTPPIKSNATKEYKRRPLLFKPTENSPDRKVVAGLRKIICSNLKEALMVLEAGLHERRVAGTGSNSVSSRSHGFFNVEVKKRRRSRTTSHWSTSTLSIVDLAGSERARDAKTQGATLAEAGKINESLMYLGQCLQMQSDAASATKPNLVPFRQCKLTELLFSNSFPSTSLAQSTSYRRPPQKGVMIVTADASGDYNANSQILRYSALAREVTVPRVPSITSTILAPGQVHQELSSSPPLTSPIGTRMHVPQTTQSRTFSPMSDTERGTMENAALEIARMADIIEQLNDELARESEARMEAEAHLMSMEDRVVELEQEIREDCYADFEQRLALEMNRWKASLSLEQERGEEHWDRKVEVLARGVGVVRDDLDDSEDDDKENVLIENLEQENDRLRREIAVLKRELTTRTPSKRAPLQERGDMHSTKNDVSSLGGSMENLRISTSSMDSEEPSKKNVVRISRDGSPTKKVRKLPARKWESIDADGDDSMA